MAQRLSIDRAHPASPTEYGFQPKAPIDPPVQHHDAGPRPIKMLLQSPAAREQAGHQAIVNDCEQASELAPHTSNRCRRHTRLLPRG
jgi:hypothetical protein